MAPSSRRRRHRDAGRPARDYQNVKESDENYMLHDPLLEAQGHPVGRRRERDNAVALEEHGERRYLTRIEGEERQVGGRWSLTLTSAVREADRRAHQVRRGLRDDPVLGGKVRR